MIGGWHLGQSGDVHQGEVRDVFASDGEDDGLGADGLGVCAEEAVGLGFDLGADLAKVVEHLRAGLGLRAVGRGASVLG